MMTNQSGLEPRGVAVLLEFYAPERKAGKIVLPDNVKERTSMLDNRAKVVAIGPEAWKDEAQPRAKVGEIVLVNRLAGFMAKGTLDGKDYRVVNDRDIFMAITAEAPLAETADE